MQSRSNLFVALLTVAIMALLAVPTHALCFIDVTTPCPDQPNQSINGNTYNCVSTLSFPNLGTTSGNGWKNSKPAITDCPYTCVRNVNGQDDVLLNHPIGIHHYKAWAAPTPGAIPCTGSGSGSGGGNGS